MNSNNTNTSKRRFFGLLGSGALVAAMSSVLPFSKAKANSVRVTDNSKEFKVKIHPMAVMRNKKG